MTLNSGDLRSTKLQLERELKQLRQQLLEVEEQLMVTRTSQRRGQGSGQMLHEQEGLALQLRRDIQRHKIALSDVEERMSAVEAAHQQDRLHDLLRTNEALKNDLDLTRRELLKCVLGMSELLRRHQRLSAEKMRVSADLAKLLGRDFAYENYISCALLHQRDYTGDVQFVLDTLKKARPVT